MPVTPRLRTLHRHMYIDLIRASLHERGSQAELARSLGVTDAYLSFALEPLRPFRTATPEIMKRYESYWIDVVELPTIDVREALKTLKVPASVRAEQIADYLALSGERRHALLTHVSLARGKDAPESRRDLLGLADLKTCLKAIGDVHQTALYSTDPYDTRNAYAGVWVAARGLLQHVDPIKHAVEFAQALMYAHDAAQVLNHHELALFYARTATLALSERASRSDEETRLRLNALFAEVVTLNSLGLKKDALDLATRARREPNYSWEPHIWTRSFLEEELTAMAGARRLSVYAAEKTADLAFARTNNDSILATTIAVKLTEIYLSHGSARSLRRARRLVERIEQAPAKAGTPLRQVRVLQTLAHYHRLMGDLANDDACMRRCREIAEVAELRHQLVRLGR